jgi:hypothetical protein
VVDHVVHQHFTLPNMARLGVAAQVICVVTVSNERGFSDMKLHMTRLRSSCGVEMLEHLMRISIEGPAIGTPECEKLLERALNHWSGLKERRIKSGLGGTKQAGAGPAGAGS